MCLHLPEQIQKTERMNREGSVLESFFPQICKDWHLAKSLSIKVEGLQKYLSSLLPVPHPLNLTVIMLTAGLTQSDAEWKQSLL